MNNSTPLDTLVKSLTDALTKSRRPESSKRRKRIRNPKGGPRANGIPRNPSSRSRDSMLSLTRDQFTATSPTNYFSVGPGSTPGGVRVKGRELINSVLFTTPNPSGAFQLSFPFALPDQTGALNPDSFPRLSAYTNIYEYFVFHKCSYLFQSNQPTTQGGEIILAVDYDPTDIVPQSTQDMMRNISSTMANVYSDCSLQALKSLSRLPKYETGQVGIEALQRVQGVLYVASEGIATSENQNLGYIIAEYDVEFFTPQ